MRVYIDLDENIDNISELYAYITTRDDKYIRVGGDFKLWTTEKTGHDGEVIKELKELEYYNRPFDNSEEEAEVATRKAQAVDMAIKALEREPSISEDGTLTVNVEDGNKVSRVLVCGDNHFGGLYYPDQELCEDTISRQAVLERLKKEDKILYTTTGLNYLIRAINELPPVTQKSETVTEFADRCRECGARYGKLLEADKRESEK